MVNEETYFVKKSGFVRGDLIQDVADGNDRTACGGRLAIKPTG